MKVIDAKKKLTALSIKEFKANQSDDTFVVVFSERTNAEFSTTLGQLEDFFKREDVEQVFVENDDVIFFSTEETTLEILGVDYKYFIAPVRNVKYKRLDKLFHSIDDLDLKIEETKIDKHTKTTKTSKSLSVICQSIDKDNNIVDSCEIEDSKSKIIESINNYYRIQLLRSRFENTIRFSFDNGQTFKTFDELVNEGVFIV